MKHRILRGIVGVVATALVGTTGAVALAPQAQAYDVCATFSTAYGYEIRYGDRDSSAPYDRGVTFWQCHLRAIGYDVAPDGVFGSNTLAAVVDWQRKHPWIGRTDGVVDYKTQSSLVAGCRPLDKPICP
ncbi:peptidoglycan-binding domain-containing protein [Georgenia deserti]|uniref:Peptidoglycan-binding protein n=1 Tax=Georgenia deserti TaxID=2093781 RepID=A0ABW4L6G7_9MICO